MRMPPINLRPWDTKGKTVRFSHVLNRQTNLRCQRQSEANSRSGSLPT